MIVTSGKYSKRPPNNTYTGLLPLQLGYKCEFSVADAGLSTRGAQQQLILDRRAPASWILLSGKWNRHPQPIDM